MAALSMLASPSSTKAKSSGGRKIIFNVDSGATTTAVAKRECEDYPVTSHPSDGYEFSTATGQRTALQCGVNLILKCTESNRLKCVRGGRFNIDRSLLAVHDMVKVGYRVVFELDDNGRDASYAQHKETGEMVRFIQRGKTWDIEFELLPWSQAKDVIEAATLAPLSEGNSSSSNSRP